MGQILTQNNTEKQRGGGGGGDLSLFLLSLSKRDDGRQTKNRHRAHRLWVWVHHPRRLPFLRPRFISHGQPHVPHWSDHDDRAASDGEIFRETSKLAWHSSTGRLL